MSEFHISVVRVGEITKHPNADLLGLTKVYDYPVIVRLGDFNPGDLAVYVPVDSIVPSDDPRWAFLDGHWRVKAKKLRGIFSCGILTAADPSWEEGQDVCEALRITKYEPPEPMTTGGEDEHNPGFMPVYTDIESLRRYPDVLIPGEEIIISEKRHGCVQARTRITMHDGSRRKITEVQIGDEVLGVRDGRITVAKVIRKFDNGTAKRWLRVQGIRSGARRGSSFFSVFCTPEHHFWSPSIKNYVVAEGLKPGDTVTLLRSELGLTPLQEQVLLGKMLGDGSLYDGVYSAHLSWSHRVQDAAYGDWTAQALGDLYAGVREPLVSGYGTEMLRWRTTNSAWIKEYLGRFFAASAEKRVPPEVADSLTPIALAFWYMDDGSLSHSKDGSEDKADFAVCSFTETDCAVLVTGLSKFGINAVYYESEGYARLRLNADDAERLFLLVAPYVPPSMQHKLPERYRGGLGWMPRADQVYKPVLVKQKILSVATAVEKGFTIRHDLETETGNYFANGVLVHNSNGRWTYQKSRLWCASHHNWKKPNDIVLWWKAAKTYDLERKLQRRPDLGFYGEVFGQVQDLKYGASNKNSLFVELFDAMDIKTKRYLDFDDFVVAAHDVDVPVVPILYQGLWSPALRSHAEGPTTTPGANHVREGMVVRPIRERWDEHIGRVVLKLHGEGYLTRK